MRKGPVGSARYPSLNLGLGGGGVMWGEGDIPAINIVYC